MATRKKRYGVLLTEDTADELRPLLGGFLRQRDFGSYLICRSIDPGGYLFHMVCVPSETAGKVGDMEIQLPHSSIRLVMCIPDANKSGFLDQ